MNLEVKKREKADFRIDIRNLKTNKVRTLSLKNNQNSTIDSIKEAIIKCLIKKS